jgi:outer membrane protein insertion porin family
MKQQERGFWSWITGSGTYSADDLDGDKETLRRLFQDHGLLDVKIGEPVVTNTTGKNIDIQIPVTEGRKYSLGKMDLQGVTIFPPNDVIKVITNKPGEVASMASIEAASKAVHYYYGNRGYISTRVAPLITPRGDSGTVDIVFNVTEGKKAFIRDILIRGNTTTKDKVIRRELTVYPDEEYNEAKVHNSENRLKNLGYFKFVNAVPQDTADPAKYDIAFEVEEQKTGNLMVGAGFSSIDNVIGFVELAQGNFDLFNWPPVGGGEKMKLRGTVGSKRRDIESSFVEPWFLDRKLALGVDLFQHDERYSRDYYLRDTGGNISLGKALGTYNRLNLIYGLQNYNVYHVATNASETIRQEEGNRLKSSVTLELVRDTRDSVFVPTRGMRSSVSAEFAGGPLGGDTDIYKFTAQASWYHPVIYEHVLNIRGWWSSVDHYGNSDRVPIFDRIFLGGARTLRGFKYRYVGPKDQNGEPVGGDTGGYLSFEYTIPIVEKVRYATFYDVGMAYPEAFDNSWNNLNSDWGMGFRFDIPGFPMRLDYAWPILHDEFNDRKNGRFQFSLGYSY